MIVYAVTGDDQSPSYWGTQAEAFKDARERSKAVGTSDPVTVERCKLVPMTKEAILRLVNLSGGFVEESEEIATFAGGRLVKARMVADA